MRSLFFYINKFYFAKKVIALAVFGILILSIKGAAGQERPWLENRFENIDRSINNGDGYSSSTNERGVLAWAEGYLLESYLVMYSVTGDRKYLDRFANHATKVIKNADINRKIRDFRGDLRHGWGSNKYSTDNKWFVNMVHSGMILNPLVKFVDAVMADQKLKSLLPSAEMYLSFAEKAVAEFESQWHMDGNTGIGEYRFLPDDPVKTNLKSSMPLNGQLAMGRVLVTLYKVTHKIEYLRAAHALALMFKRSLLINDDDAYFWGYRANMKKYPQVEDISHGAIELDFALLCYSNGIVFTDSDANRFAKTLSSNILKGADISDKVNGIGTVNTFKSSLGRWLDLAPFDCKVWIRFAAIVSSDAAEKHPQVMLGIANLIKYYEICKPDATRLSR